MKRDKIVTMVVAYTITLFIVLCCVLMLIHIAQNPNSITFGGW